MRHRNQRPMAEVLRALRRTATLRTPGPEVTSSSSRSECGLVRILRIDCYTQDTSQRQMSVELVYHTRHNSSPIPSIRVRILGSRSTLSWVPYLSRRSPSNTDLEHYPPLNPISLQNRQEDSAGKLGPCRLVALVFLLGTGSDYPKHKRQI